MIYERRFSGGVRFRRSPACFKFRTRTEIDAGAGADELIRMVPSGSICRTLRLRRSVKVLKLSFKPITNILPSARPLHLVSLGPSTTTIVAHTLARVSRALRTQREHSDPSRQIFAVMWFFGQSCPLETGFPSGRR
jgi:hypothetical protein